MFWTKEIFMFNIAVINIKDIAKNLLRIIVAIVIICLAASILGKDRRNNLVETAKSIQISENSFFNISLLKCFDICVPGMKQIKFEKKNALTLGKLLDVELSMANHIEEQKLDMSLNQVDEKRKCK